MMTRLFRSPSRLRTFFSIILIKGSRGTDSSPIRTTTVLDISPPNFPTERIVNTPTVEKNETRHKVRISSQNDNRMVYSPS